MPSTMATLINSQCAVKGDNIGSVVRGKGECDSSRLHTANAYSPVLYVCVRESKAVLRVRHGVCRLICPSAASVLKRVSV